MKCLYLATCAALPNLAAEDAPLLPALRALGVPFEVVVWDSPDVDWGKAGLCVVRTAWDYHLKRDAFLEWARHVDRQTVLLNPAPVIAWNTEKTYLRDLEARGFPMIPTAWLTRGEQVDLQGLLAARGWNDAVVKPVISASAHRTLRVSGAMLAGARAHLEALLEEQGALVQPYLPAVEGHGERALIFIEGEFSHAVRKSPALAQDGGDPAKVELVAVSSEELRLATSLVRTIRPTPLYARADLVQSEAGAKVMEFELVEPSLYLDLSPEGTERFAAAIARRFADAVGHPRGDSAKGHRAAFP